MKKLLIASAMASALALSSMGANAKVIKADGIVWDSLITDNGVSNQTNFQQWFTTSASTTDSGLDAMDTGDDYERISTAAAVAAPGVNTITSGGNDVFLTGIGEFYSFNAGRAPGALAPDEDFCDPVGCELTFAFGGLKLTSNPGGGVSPTFDTAGAWFNIYYDTTPDFDTSGVNDTTLGPNAHLGFADAQDGKLWLALDIDFFDLDGTIIGGETESFLTVRHGVTGNPTGAEAAWDYNNADWGGRDFAFTADAIFLPSSLYSTDGNGQGVGFSVPEPATVSIFGLGLLGMSAFARRRKAK